MRKLFNSIEEKEIKLYLQNNVLISEIIKNSKSKITSKEFDNEDLAKLNLKKKEWELIKKGYIYKNEIAKLGESILHTYIGRGYTGALSFAATPKGIYVYKHGTFDAKVNIEFIVLINFEGQILETIQLPVILPWKIEFNSKRNTLLLDLDHKIYEFCIDNNKFTKLLERYKSWMSFISVSNNNFAYGCMPNIYVLNNDNSIQIHKEYQIENAFDSTLSSIARVSPLFDKPGQIQFIDTNSGNIKSTLVTDYQSLLDLKFCNNDKYLAVNENYRKVRFFDIENLLEISFPEIVNYGVMNYCFNFDQTKLIISTGYDVTVFDFETKKKLYQFELEHVVKKGFPKFIDNNHLGVRSDYGCFSIYKI